MTWVEVLLAAVIAVGLVGIVVPLLPGSVLVLIAIAAWAVERGTTTGWAVLAAAVVLLAAGAVVKYVVPGRRLQQAGVPSSTQWWGVLGGIIGFFVVPVLGLLLGFVAGVYLAERQRLGPVAARSSTRQAIGAAGLSVLIELVAALLATGVWLTAVLSR